MYDPNGNDLNQTSLDYRWGNMGRETYKLDLYYDTTVTKSYSLVWEITSEDGSVTFQPDIGSYNACGLILCIFLDTSSYILYLYVANDRATIPINVKIYVVYNGVQSSIYTEFDFSINILPCLVDSSSPTQSSVVGESVVWSGTNVFPLTTY
jgi:hypothetical protein